jgi:hypothetical protein
MHTPELISLNDVVRKIESGINLKPTCHDTYVAVIPQTVTPGSSRILPGIVDAKGRRFLFESLQISPGLLTNIGLPKELIPFSSFWSIVQYSVFG